MLRLTTPRGTRLTFALLSAFAPCLALATPIEYEILPFSATFNRDLRAGDVDVSDVGSMTVSASGASAAADFGELVALQQDIAVTIDGTLANAFSLFDGLILPQFLQIPPFINPFIESAPFGFEQFVTLNGDPLFQLFTAVEMQTVHQNDLLFDRTVSVIDELGLDLVLVGFNIDTTQLRSEFSDPASFSFSGNDTQTLNFSWSLTFSVNSLTPISVPEPGTLWLLASGLFAAAVLSRRHRKIALSS